MGGVENRRPAAGRAALTQPGYRAEFVRIRHRCRIECALALARSRTSFRQRFNEMFERNVTNPIRETSPQGPIVHIKNIQ
jgi:hypothetical protein